MSHVEYLFLDEQPGAVTSWNDIVKRVLTDCSTNFHFYIYFLSAKYNVLVSELINKRGACKESLEMPPVWRQTFRTYDSSFKMNPSVCPPELRPRDREPPDAVPQAERFGEEPPKLHPGPAEGRTLRWTSFPEATQWFPHLGGGSDWRSQEPASLARQVGTKETYVSQWLTWSCVYFLHFFTC